MGSHFPSVKLLLVAVVVVAVRGAIVIIAVLFFIVLAVIVKVLIGELFVILSLGQILRVCNVIKICINGSVVLKDVGKLYLIAVFIKNLDVKAKSLKLLNENLKDSGMPGVGMF